VLTAAESMAPAPNDGWRASLGLEYACVEGRSVLTRRMHSGPLAVQKSLYPEGAAVCHTLILHPPGGVVGADTLTIELDLRAGSHALVTMPGAGKWYRSDRADASQQVEADIGPGATLEWLPPETIVFNGAHVRLRTGVRMAAGGAYVGWEILCLGRTASGEKFDCGSIHQTTDVTFEGEPVWAERCRLGGGSPLLRSAAGLHGAPVTALMLAVGKSVPAALLTQCRAVALDAPGRSGISAMGNVMAVRYIGHSAEQAKNYFIAVWCVLRPFFSGRAAVTPRIWNT